jgi:hypothetical protein
VALILIGAGVALFVVGMLLTGADQAIQASGVQDIHGAELPEAGAGALDPPPGGTGGDISGSATGAGGLPFSGFGVLALGGLALILAFAGTVSRPRGR